MDPIQVVGQVAAGFPVDLRLACQAMPREWDEARTQRPQGSKNSEPLDFRGCGLSAHESLLSCLGSVSFAKVVLSWSCTGCFSHNFAGFRYTIWHVRACLVWRPNTRSSRSRLLLLPLQPTPVSHPGDATKMLLPMLCLSCDVCLVIYISTGRV